MNKFNFRFVLKTMGFLLIIESLFLMVSTIIAFLAHESCGDTMLFCSSITFLSGIFVRLLGTDDKMRPIGKRESFLLVSLSWVVLSAFGMLPYYLSGAIPNITDAFFETMSGFTTTGATILTDIEIMPRGLLFWRSVTQWIGGIGIVVFALAILPMIGGNASALFDAESSGIRDERIQPRMTKVAEHMFLIYVGLTSLMCLLLWLGPMNLFDSICHSMTTFSTGGYSTKQSGIAFWNSPYLEYVACIFMLLGGVNFSLFYFVFKGNAKKMLHNEEFRWYASIVFIFITIMTIYLLVSNRLDDAEKAFRYSFFQIASVATGTGFTVPDYMSWGPFFFFIMCFSMFFCACVGSTSGGAKIVRLVVASKNAINEFKRQLHPNAILPVRLNGRVLSSDIVSKITAFLFIYVIILVLSSLLLSILGFSFEESIGASISCMGNVGPGLGTQGEAGHFAQVPAFSKWFLCLLMLTGRLELFTVLSLFMPSFWKK